ncbi:MAG TPA: excinuclease ABC subunit UvrA [Dissulfurispiraceae bacterium]|nr:excinuclease ABC subunit UvrA [Dissulfurispiraceae bacterium]
MIIEGARQNNLKNLNLRLPHNNIIAITGVSGSGKSSLAFDTIFAEGQWRFIESLSTYARLFLEKLDRPDVDSILNIRPAIALEQKNPVKGSRSTVGTLTELFDLFRVLYSKVAVPYCPNCGREVRKWDTSQIVAELLESCLDERALITFETSEGFDSLVSRGFRRLLLDGEIKDIETIALESATEAVGNSYTVVLDRLVIRDEPRLSDSIESAWREGHGHMSVVIVRSTDEGMISLTPLRFSSANMCDECGNTVPEASPMLFSFNHPLCACPECKGFGNILKYDEDLIVANKHLSISEGAIDLWEKPGYRWWKDQLLKGAKKAGIDVTIPYSQLSDEARKTVFNGNGKFYGINAFFEELENKRYKLHVRVLLSRYRSPVICPKCGGKRLCDDALAYKIEGFDIADLSRKPVGQLAVWFSGLQLSPMKRDIAKEVIKQIIMKLDFLIKVGLDYLTPARQAKTLSGGEYQRVNLSNQLASALTGTLYVLDEPTIGLHPRDTRRIADIMSQLASLGNTIIVVEHDKDMIASSDWVVELGPGGGHMGGDIVFSGPIRTFMESDTRTARYLRGVKATDAATKRTNGKHSEPSGRFITLSGASGNNLANVEVKIPLEALTVVSGVSGSGKSSLIVETLYNAVARHFRLESEPPLPYLNIEGLNKLNSVRLIDQSPVGRTPRSNPLTYLKIFEPIRKLFSQQSEAKAHGYTPGFFSFNMPGGRCETCKGEGYQKLEMYFFEDIYVKCEDCKGRRYREETLRVTYSGKNISDILGMTVDEAYSFFEGVPEICSRMEMLKSIGLGYLVLGQPATTLSGGEAQRLKICSELSKASARGVLYILDEPTVGLHHDDVIMLVRIIRRLVDSGNTVVIIEHNLDIIGRADWIIDLGPEGGEKGGSVVFQGPPDGLRGALLSHTARYLEEYSI